MKFVVDVIGTFRIVRASMKQILVLLISASFTAAAIAHPGKTDAKGGHTDSKTGKYHVHKKEDAPKKAEPKKGEVKKKK